MSSYYISCIDPDTKERKHYTVSHPVYHYIKLLEFAIKNPTIDTKLTDIYPELKSNNNVFDLIETYINSKA